MSIAQARVELDKIEKELTAEIIVLFDIAPNGKIVVVHIKTGYWDAVFAGDPGSYLKHIGNSDVGVPDWAFETVQKLWRISCDTVRYAP